MQTEWKPIYSSLEVRNTVEFFPHSVPGEISLNTVDFSNAPWLLDFKQRIEENWHLSLSSRIDIQDRDCVVIRAKIKSDGTLADAEFIQKTEKPQLNKAAMRSLYAASPFNAFPDAFSVDPWAIVISFYYGNEAKLDRIRIRREVRNRETGTNCDCPRSSHWDGSLDKLKSEIKADLIKMGYD